MLCLLLSSIPVETTLDGQQRYSKCFMYDIHYDKKTVAPSNGTKKIPCKNGWVYDNEHRKSVVTQVRCFLHPFVSIFTFLIDNK